MNSSQRSNDSKIIFHRHSAIKFVNVIRMNHETTRPVNCASFTSSSWRSNDNSNRWSKIECYAMSGLETFEVTKCSWIYSTKFTVKTLLEFMIDPRQLEKPKVKTPAINGYSSMDASLPPTIKLELSEPSFDATTATKIPQTYRKNFITSKLRNFNCAARKKYQAF